MKKLVILVCVLSVLQIFQACHVCQAQPRLFTTHGAQIHTLLVRRSCLFLNLLNLHKTSVPQKPGKLLAHYWDCMCNFH